MNDGLDTGRGFRGEREEEKAGANGGIEPSTNGLRNHFAECATATQTCAIALQTKATNALVRFWTICLHHAQKRTSGVAICCTPPLPVGGRESQKRRAEPHSPGEARPNASKPSRVASGPATLSPTLPPHSSRPPAPERMALGGAEAGAGAARPFVTPRLHPCLDGREGGDREDVDAADPALRGHFQGGRRERLALCPRPGFRSSFVAARPRDVPSHPHGPRRAQLGRPSRRAVPRRLTANASGRSGQGSSSTEDR